MSLFVYLNVEIKVVFWFKFKKKKKKTKQASASTEVLRGDADELEVLASFSCPFFSLVVPIPVSTLIGEEHSKCPCTVVLQRNDESSLVPLAQAGCGPPGDISLVGQ